MAGSYAKACEQSTVWNAAKKFAASRKLFELSTRSQTKIRIVFYFGGLG